MTNPEHIYFGERFKICFKDDAEWFDFYGEVKEGITIDDLVPYLKDMEINDWVNEDHAEDCITSRSHIGVLIFIKLAPIVWYSKF